MIIYKLKSFPNISETFIVSNIVYTLNRGFDLKIYLDEYLGIKNSSQKELFNEYNLESYIAKTSFKTANKFSIRSKLICFFLNPKNLLYLLKYWMLDRSNLKNKALILYDYRNFPKKSVCHVHFNNAIEPLVNLSTIGYISPKVIITFHGYDAFLIDSYQYTMKYEKFYKKYVEWVTVNSDYIKKRILKLGIPENIIKIVPPGIDYNTFKGVFKPIDKKKVKLLSVGRLVSLKGHIYGIRAVKELVKKGYNIEYSIVGCGIEKNNLKKEISKLNLDESVFLLGAKSQQEIVKIMSEHDLLLMTSTIDELTGRREAFGLVSVEAQASAMPVLGFNSGGFVETLINERTGFIVPDKNFRILANKIETLINSPKLYEQFSKNAMKHASKFDLKINTEKYLDLYIKVLLK